VLCVVLITNPKNAQYFVNCSAWVKAQRQQMKLFWAGKKSSLTGAKVAKLTSIGFIVDANEYRKRFKVDDHRRVGAEDDYDEPPRLQGPHGYYAHFQI